MTLYGSGFDESGMRIKDAMEEIVEDEWVWHSGTGVEMGRCREWSDGKGKERWERGGVVNCLCTGRGWNKVETWKNIYMDRRRPPPPGWKWKIAPPTGAEKCKLLLFSCISCKTVRILTVFSRFYQLQLPLYNIRYKTRVTHHVLHNIRFSKQLLTDPVENSVEYPVENSMYKYSPFLHKYSSVA